MQQIPEATQTAETILLIDDDELLRARLAKSLEKRGYVTFQAENQRQAVELVDAHPISQAIIDLKLPGNNGLDVLKTLRQRKPELVAVVLTGYGSIASAIEAIRLGAVHYLTKPTDTESILAALNGQSSNQTANSSGRVHSPSLSQVEWEHIQRVLADCEGNISLAAKRLGIHRRSLQRKLMKAP